MDRIGNYPSQSRCRPQQNMSDITASTQHPDACWSRKRITGAIGACKGLARVQLSSRFARRRCRLFHPIPSHLSLPKLRYGEHGVVWWELVAMLSSCLPDASYANRLSYAASVTIPLAFPGPQIASDCGLSASLAHGNLQVGWAGQTRQPGYLLASSKLGIS